MQPQNAVISGYSGRKHDPISGIFYHLKLNQTGKN